ncbi:MAG: hypothetical protein RL237_157, partial [Actinomycetota bacterium]
PRVAIAELTPTTAPVISTSGPPEFPGLIAASVCNALINELSPELSPVVNALFFALIIHDVTVPDKPSGEPIAITVSPTKMLSLLPNCRVGAEVTSIFKTAKS